MKDIICFRNESINHTNDNMHLQLVFKMLYVELIHFCFTVITSIDNRNLKKAIYLSAITIIENLKAFQHLSKCFNSTFKFPSNILRIMITRLEISASK